MNRNGKLMMVLLMAAVGLWGCSQAATSQSETQAERIKTLEARNSKLEDDFKSAASARDLARKQLAALQEEHTQLQDQQTALQKEVDAGKEVAKERDDLRTQVQALNGARDLLQTRCEKLKTGLQALIGQDDALSAPNHPPTAVGGVAGGGS